MDSSEPQAEPASPNSSGEAVIPCPASDLPVEYQAGTSSAAFAFVRIAEIIGQTIRWVFFCCTSLSAVYIVVHGWAEMNSRVQYWWQSPLIAVLVVSVGACAFMLMLSIMMLTNRKSTNRLTDDERAALTVSKSKHLTDPK